MFFSGQRGICYEKALADPDRIVLKDEGVLLDLVGECDPSPGSTYPRVDAQCNWPAKVKIIPIKPELTAKVDNNANTCIANFIKQCGPNSPLPPLEAGNPTSCCIPAPNCQATVPTAMTGADCAQIVDPIFFVKGAPKCDGTDVLKSACPEGAIGLGINPGTISLPPMLSQELKNKFSPPIPKPSGVEAKANILNGALTTSFQLSSYGPLSPMTSLMYSSRFPAYGPFGYGWSIYPLRSLSGGTGSGASILSGAGDLQRFSQDPNTAKFTPGFGVASTLVKNL